MTAGVPASTTGHDPAKRVPCRKLGLAVDNLGLVIAVAVLAANTHDNTAGGGGHEGTALIVRIHDNRKDPRPNL